MAKDNINAIGSTGKLSADARLHKSQKAHAAQKLKNTIARQVQSQNALKTWGDQALFNPITMRQKFDTLKKGAEPKKEAEKGEKSESEHVDETDAIEHIAKNYNARNPELQEKTLMLLQQQIKNDDDTDEILRKLGEFYADKFLADEAVSFLIEAATTKEEMRNKLIQAKEQFNASYGEDIRAGRNIAEESRTFSQQGLGSPTGLRDLYRNLIATPRSSHELFEELTEKFKFSDMKNIIDFILHSLGSDLKSKGPSISKAELQRLFTEARNMQAILGVFRFFYVRMKLIKGQFDQHDLTMPSAVNFELLAKLLMKFLQERYPSPDKILKLSFLLGISKEIAAQIIIFTQYRNALRHLSPKLFKSERHRQDLLMTFIETLSDLEDEIEEEEQE